jgi:hypothetical protein
MGPFIFRPLTNWRNSRASGRSFSRRDGFGEANRAVRGRMDTAAQSWAGADRYWREKIPEKKNGRRAILPATPITKSIIAHSAPARKATRRDGRG